jgi:hypothetical protein
MALRCNAPQTLERKKNPGDARVFLTSHVIKS